VGEGSAKGNQELWEDRKNEIAFLEKVVVKPQLVL
jgi:hypothetical protein